MSCCSNVGEILVLPKERGAPVRFTARHSGGPGGASVASSWEEFIGLASPQDVTEGMRDRNHSLSAWPYVMKVPAEAVEDELVALRHDPAVRAATRNWRVSLDASARDLAGVSVDMTRIAHFLDRHGLLAPRNDRRAASTQRVRVAVLDSGVGPDAVLDAALEDRQIDVITAASALRTEPHDPNGHGSVAAGLIHLVAPTAEIVSVRCFSNGGAALSDIVSALLLARLLDERIDVFNLSFSVDFTVTNCPNCHSPIGSSDDRVALANLFAFLRTELEDRPILVAAAGNSGARVATPAALDGVIAVGSTGVTPVDAPAPDPGYDSVPRSFILAPGGSSDSPVTTGGRLYRQRFWGTSFATAVVTGVVASLLGASPRHGIPTTPDESRKAAVREALETLAWKGYDGYDLDTHGMGALRPAASSLTAHDDSPRVQW